MLRIGLLSMFLTVTSAFAQSETQTSEGKWEIYTEHPRLFLNAQRLRLLKRERERMSQRWTQFDTLISGKAQFPEPAVAHGLYFQVTEQPESAARAIQSALASNADPRHVALVYDWCQNQLSEAQKANLSARLTKVMSGPSPDILTLRSRILAAIVLGKGETLEQIIRNDWTKTAQSLTTRRQRINGPELFAIYEILHAVRDNTNNDLRESYGEFFRNLPHVQLLSYYPAPFPSSENDYRIPAYSGRGDPDLKDATFSRIAELSMIAFDRNSVEVQFLQGWVNNDHYQLNGSLGVAYEFLWANPYQPGLTYQNLPTYFYDPIRGLVLARSTWDEDATWFGIIDGQPQSFDNGQRRTGLPKQDRVGDVAIQKGTVPMKFEIRKDDPGLRLLLGLAPSRSYVLEVDDEEMTEVRSTASGILVLDLKRSRETGARLALPWQPQR